MKEEGSEEEQYILMPVPSTFWRVIVWLCGFINAFLWVLLILLILSFVKEGAVLKQVARVDDRFDVAV